MKKKYLTIIFLILIMLFSVYNLYNAKVMLKSYSNYYSDVALPKNKNVKNLLKQICTFLNIK